MYDYKQLPRHSLLCIDMKSFFASVEAVRRGFNPLKVFLCVVGDKKRNGSIVLAASPRMKEVYGIKTGNRLYEIPKLKHIHIVEANMSYYLDQSVKITKLLNQFVPIEAIHQYSIDEAWVCLNGTERIHGHKWKAAQKIRKAIWNQFGLPSCIGIGPNKFLSKVILDLEAKKTGIAECTYEQVPEKIWPIKVEEIWGIGERIKKRLNSMGIYTMEHLAKMPLPKLKTRFGVMGEQLYWHAHGIDLSPVTGNFGEAEQKGFGHGITLLRDYHRVDEIKIVILELCEEVARRCRQANMAAYTIYLRIGYSRMEETSGFGRSKTLERATNITKEIYATAIQLFENNYRGHVVRSIYLSISNLVPDDAIQLDFFEDVTKKKVLGNVMDSIREKYGSGALLRASSYAPGGTMVERSSKIGGHKA